MKYYKSKETSSVYMVTDTSTVRVSPEFTEINLYKSVTLMGSGEEECTKEEFMIALYKVKSVIYGELAKI